MLARAGIASRREAERMIAAGRVSVNGKKLTGPAFLVSPTDTIKVDGKTVASAPAIRLWRYHKPAGLLTTHNDPGGRPTVFAALPKKVTKEAAHIISVGRLDLNSEGLLLLTNHGGLARALELPSTGFARRYRVRAFGETDQDILDTLQAGAVIDNIKTGPIEAKLDSRQGSNVWMTVLIREGKNREVRKAMETIDLRVNRLIRISYGPFQLGDLARGAAASVPQRILRDQLGHLVDIPNARKDGTLSLSKSKQKQRNAHRRRRP